MTTRFTIPLAGLALAAICLTASAAARRPAGQWAYFHFDGRSFSAGQPEKGTPFVAVRDGVLPQVLTRSVDSEAVQLPSGSGAVAGICYVSASGGKLKPGPGYLPVSGLQVRISSGGKVLATVLSDDHGYFVAELPAGSYRVSARESVEVKVEQGNTTLVPLRVGKRMVD